MGGDAKAYLNSVRLKPLRDLCRDDLGLVLDRARVTELKPRSLIEPEDDMLTYLLEGKVTLLQDGVVVEEFNHMEQRALAPMFADGSENVSALLLSHGTIVEVGRKLLYALLAQNEQGDSTASEIILEQAESELFESLMRAYDENRLQLPALPEAALRIREAVNTPGIKADEIVQIVQTDPVLSARLVKVANSALYGTWREIKTIRDAVRRLGLETTRNLSFSLSVKQLFHARTSLIKKKVQQAYDESVNVGTLAFVIARHRAPHLDPEQALLGGLIEGLGTIPILQFVDQHPDVLQTPAALESGLKKLSVPITTRLLSQWNFDADFIDIIEHCNDFSRDTGERADYADMIVGARVIYLEQRNLLDPDINVRALPIVSKLRLFEMDEEGNYLVDIAKRELDTMNTLLQ